MAQAIFPNDYLKQIDAIRQQVLAQNGIQQGQAVNWAGLGSATGFGFSGDMNQQARFAGDYLPQTVLPEEAARNVFNDAFEHKPYSQEIKVQAPKKALFFNRINERVPIDYYGVTKKDEPLDELRIEVAQWLNN
ncbi:MAG TPA: hypothetical protein ENH85_09800 [Candidatus Scalindua sp.]|nr:hypothetical protein [Candidatus Scalindua sp.]